MNMSLQEEYILHAGQGHRKKYAQYFTPRPIVKFMQAWVLDGKQEACLFDPAFGLGAFAEGLPDGVALQGMEVDSVILDFFHSHAQGANVKVANDNYLTHFGETYANIICNPPYLKFHKFADKELVLRKFKENMGIVLSGYTNTASAFLVKSISELREGGRLAYIMPSEFLNTGYGRQVKEILLRERHLAGIVRIACEQEAFPDATTSLCILLYDTSRRHEKMAFYSVEALDRLAGLLGGTPLNEVPYDTLSPEGKWAVHFESKAKMCVCDNRKMTELATYGHFSRGIATGANDFFVLKKSKIDSLNLPDGDFSPCITRSAQIRKSIFTQKDFQTLAQSDSGVFLFNVGDKPSPQAASYIRQGERQGFSDGYLARSRPLWYRMERRSPAPIMVNVFSRHGYKVIRNFSNVLSLTPFHCFYPNLMGLGRVDALFLYLLSGVGHDILSFSMRKYGNALDKFEPNDLNHALVPSEAFLDSIAPEKVEDLLGKLEQGQDVKPELDALFAPLVN